MKRLSVVAVCILSCLSTLVFCSPHVESAAACNQGTQWREVIGRPPGYMDAPTPSIWTKRADGKWDKAFEKGNKITGVGEIITWGGPYDKVKITFENKVYVGELSRDCKIIDGIMGESRGFYGAPSWTIYITKQ